MADNFSCGPQWWPKILRKFLSQRFEAECKVHDAMYAEGVARSDADRLFRQGLKERAGDDFRWQVAAFLFGAAVTLGGWLFKRPRKWFWQKW